MTISAVVRQDMMGMGDEEKEAIKIAYFNPQKTPVIPENVNYDEFVQYFKFPELFHLYRIERDEGSIKFVLNNGEDSLNVVKIPDRLFAPSRNNVKFPKFLLNVSRFTATKVDYSKLRLTFNQNELLWLAIQHRLQFFSIYKRAYAYLLTKDIQNIIDYGDYNIYNAFNARVKSHFSVAVLDVFVMGKVGLEHYGAGDQIVNAPYEIVRPIGENIGTPKITQNFVNNLFRDLRILPGSESMASESGKFVVCPDGMSSDDFYSSAGFRLKNDVIETIFGVKSNIPARFKSHVICDSFRAEKWDAPIFAEDVIPFLANQTDETIINAVCVFMPIEETSGRFMCGEIECSDKFARNRVIKREIVKGQFSLMAVKEGQEVKQRDGKFTLGIDENFEEVSLYGFDSVQVVSVERIGISEHYKIVCDCVRKIGSTRIISSTGVKGVTKPRKDLGILEVMSPSGQNALLDVDLLIGPNSLKAKDNTVFLAQAAMAHVLGYNHPETQISSFDIKRINELKAHVTEAWFTDTHGVRQKVYAGIVPIKISELAYMYKNAKKQSFMTQSGWHLATSGFEDIAEEIWNTSVSQEDVSIIQELTKIIYDDVGKFIELDGLPVYSVHDVAMHFSLEDVALETNPLTLHKSKLVQTDNKGFYIHLPHTGEFLRMPSAALIERFTSQIADGSFIYPRLLTVASQILQTCLVKNQVNDKINLGFIARKGISRFSKSIALANKYIDLCMGILHYKNNQIGLLMKPKVFGCDMKQMVDVHVPSGVIVILDRNLYERLGQETDGYLEKHNEFYALTIRNPVLWKAQVQSMKVWDYEMFKAWLRLGVPGREGIDIEEYFNHRYCKDLVLLNPHDAVLQQSDVDGDLMPVFVPRGMEMQKRLATFNIMEKEDSKGLPNITKHELDWIEDYRKSEMDSNCVFVGIEERQYKTHKIALSSLDSSEKTFSKYFGNSVVAKGDIGLATFNLWQLQCLLDIYTNECEAGNIKDLKGELVKFKRKDYDLISFAYTRILQDLVVRGIKWNESGSSEFAPFMLTNMVTRQHRQSTFRYLTDVCKLPIETCSKMFEILSWGTSNGVVEAIGMFIGLYNSGKNQKYQVTPQFEEKLLETFYGKRLQFFFDVRNMIMDAKAGAFKHKMPGYVEYIEQTAPVTTGKNLIDPAMLAMLANMK